MSGERKDRRGENREIEETSNSYRKSIGPKWADQPYILRSGTPAALLHSFTRQRKRQKDATKAVGGCTGSKKSQKKTSASIASAGNEQF